MKLVNETDTEVFYSISSPGTADCGTIKEHSLVDLPGYDNKDNVVVSFTPVGATYFATTIPNGGVDKGVTMAVAVE